MRLVLGPATLTTRGASRSRVWREPGHQGLCELEQAYVLKAITEDIDLDRHMSDAVQSLRICLGADESVRTGRTVKLT